MNMFKFQKPDNLVGPSGDFSRYKYDFGSTMRHVKGVGISNSHRRDIIELSNQTHCKKFISKIETEHFSPNSHWLLYLENGKVLGFLRFLLEDNIIHNLIIEVNNKDKGRGIGKDLLNELKEFAKNKEIKLIKCEIELSNEISIKLFEKQGFEVEEIENRKNKDFGIFCLKF